MVKELVLIPISEYNHIERNKVPSEEQILKSINEPEKVQMVKNFELANKSLNDPQKDDEQKLVEYNEFMNKFDFFKKNQTEQSNDLMKKIDYIKKNKAEQEMSGLDKTGLDVPVDIREKANNFMGKLHGYSDLISWNKRGDLLLKRKKAPKKIEYYLKNILNPKGGTFVGMEPFLQTLHEIPSFPQSLIKNNAANRYYKSLSTLRPPGVRERKRKMEDEKIDWVNS